MLDSISYGHIEGGVMMAVMIWLGGGYMDIAVCTVYCAISTLQCSYMIYNFSVSCVRCVVCIFHAAMCEMCIEQ